MDTSSDQRHEEEAPSIPEKNKYCRYIPLYQAALRGDWANAERFFHDDQDAPNAYINEYLETALYVAVAGERSTKTTNFVRNILNKMSPEALKLCNETKNTAFFNAAWAGNTEAVKLIFQKRPSLLYMRNRSKFSPLDIAALQANKDTLLYLLEATKNKPYRKLFPDEDCAGRFLSVVIYSGYYDIALYLVEKYPDLAVSREKHNGNCGLRGLPKRSAFKSGCNYQWWQWIIYDHVPAKLDDYRISHMRRDIENAVDDPQATGRKYNWARHLVDYFCISVPCIKHIQEQKEMHLQALKLLKCLCERVRSLNDFHAYGSFAAHALNFSAKIGIHEPIEEIVESFPSMVWAQDYERRNLVQRAVIERHVNVYNLTYQMGNFRRDMVHRTDSLGNNLLHLAGRLAPPNKNDPVSGAALQMQRELQWFEEVKKHATPGEIDRRNAAGRTPEMVFTEEHKKLVAKGEKWIKHTANSCTIPAALIVTVVFAAAITVPGGNDVNNGIPIFSKEVAFNIFAVFDAISLFASITSLLVFLSVLTSQYAEGDFLFALPNRLIIGLVTLFLSITAMVIAFSSALYLTFGTYDKAWILYPVSALACIPIISFASLQFPLLIDLMKSTYGRGVFGKQSERMIF